MGDRTILGKAISLIESNLALDQATASQLVSDVLSKTGNSIRIGITGVPGVGKSTFIEAFGKHVTSLGKKIAVLTVDPSSQLTKGSILGDKTRMEELSKNKLAFIRPSASGNRLGGVATKTREAILLCEAAGYDVIVVETVGVGQSETSVKNMVDFFLLLMLAGAGDELQGIKKGIMEMAEAVVINKADGDNVKHASAAKAEYQHALHLMPPSTSGWTPKVLTCSAATNTGIKEIWEIIVKFKEETSASGFFEDNRVHQNIAWFTEHFGHLLNQNLEQYPTVKKERSDLEKKIGEQKISAQSAANHLLTVFLEAIKKT
jgi:LAO/AO transport system kinase